MTSRDPKEFGFPTDEQVERSDARRRGRAQHHTGEGGTKPIAHPVYPTAGPGLQPLSPAVAAPILQGRGQRGHGGATGGASAEPEDLWMEETSSGWALWLRRRKRVPEPLRAPEERVPGLLHAPSTPILQPPPRGTPGACGAVGRGLGTHVDARLPWGPIGTGGSGLPLGTLEKKTATVRIRKGSSRRGETTGGLGGGHTGTHRRAGGSGRAFVTLGKRRKVANGVCHPTEPGPAVRGAWDQLCAFQTRRKAPGARMGMEVRKERALVWF